MRHPGRRTRTTAHGPRDSAAGAAAMPSCGRCVIVNIAPGNTRCTARASPGTRQRPAWVSPARSRDGPCAAARRQSASWAVCDACASSCTVAPEGSLTVTSYPNSDSPQRLTDQGAAPLVSASSLTCHGQCLCRWCHGCEEVHVAVHHTRRGLEFCIVAEVSPTIHGPADAKTQARTHISRRADTIAFLEEMAKWYWGPCDTTYRKVRHDEAQVGPPREHQRPICTG